MAMQGATLQRRGSQVPVLLVAAFVALALATAIIGVAVNVMDDVRPARSVTSIQELDGTGPRGATLDAVLEARAIRDAEVAVSETVGPFHPMGHTHEVAEVIVRTDTPATTSYTDCIHCAQRR